MRILKLHRKNKTMLDNETTNEQVEDATEEVAVEETDTDITASEDEYVEPHEASDDAIEEFLQEALKYGVDEDGQPLEEGEDDSEDSEEEQHADEDEEAEETEEGAQEEPATEESASVTRAEYEALKQQLDSSIQHSQNQAQFINERNLEIGKLRNEKRGLLSQLQQGQKDRWEENPAEAHKVEKAIEQITGEIQQLDKQENYNNHVHKSLEIIQKNVEVDKIDTEELSFMLTQADGLPHQYVKQFCADPIAQADPLTLVQMFKRAQEMGVTRKLAKAYQDLKAKYDKAVNEKDTPLKTVSKVLRTNTGAKIPGKSLSSKKRSSVDISARDLANLSDNELDELLRNSA